MITAEYTVACSDLAIDLVEGNTYTREKLKTFKAAAMQEFKGKEKYMINNIIDDARMHIIKKQKDSETAKAQFEQILDNIATEVGPINKQFHMHFFNFKSKENELQTAQEKLDCLRECVKENPEIDNLIYELDYKNMVLKMLLVAGPQENIAEIRTLSEELKGLIEQRKIIYPGE